MTFDPRTSMSFRDQHRSKTRSMGAEERAGEDQGAGPYLLAIGVVFVLVVGALLLLR
jgi:hypothetical protein